MRIASFAFLLILTFLHLVSPSYDTLATPLSEFRDGPLRVWGFLLFGLLILICGLWIRTMARLRDLADLLAVIPGVLMLGFVAFTPSWGFWHLVCSLVLFGWLLVFFTLKLLEAESLLAFPNLMMPALLALIVRGHSFGLWQKMLIVYCVTAINIYDMIRLSELDEKPRHRTWRRWLTRRGRKLSRDSSPQTESKPTSIPRRRNKPA